MQERPEYWEILFREVHLLPDELGHLARIRQREYVAEWVRLLRLARPELDGSTASILVQAVLLGLADVVRTSTVSSRPGYADELEDLSMQVLMTAGSPA